LPDIPDWCPLQEETLSKYADLFNVAGDIVSITPHGAGVKACFSLTYDTIGWRE